MKLNSDNIFEMSYWFDLRVQFFSYTGLGPSDPREDRADCIDMKYGRYCQRINLHF